MDLFAIAIGIILGLLNIFLKRQERDYNICRTLSEKHYSNLCKTHGKEAVSFCFEKKLYICIKIILKKDNGEN